MPTETPPFIPAAHFHALTPVYEKMARPFTGRCWRRIAIEAARRAPREGRVVDLGCGPGSILRRLRQLRSDLRLAGTDIDPGIIRIAQRKAAECDIAFSVSSIDRQPFPDRSVDIAICSLMFHHLSLSTKRSALQEVRRILTPDGTFLLCDFSVPSGRRWWEPSARFWKWIEPETAPQIEGQLLTLASECGATTESLATFYGCIVLHLLRFPTKA